MSNYTTEARSSFDQAIEHFIKELKNLRTNRANASLVEDIRIEAYDQNMDLKSVASITTPDSHTIQIEPWDKNLVPLIEKALTNSNLGMMPQVAGLVIRLNMPPMTEENRKDIVKVIKQKSEQARITIRNIREEIRDQISKDEKSKTITEDDKYSILEELDKIVSEFNKKIDVLAKEKEDDVMKI